MLKLLERLCEGLAVLDQAELSTSQEALMEAIRLLDETKDEIEETLGGLDLRHSKPGLPWEE